MKNGGPPERAWFRQGNCKPCKVRTTKYLYLQSTTVHVPSSELGLPQPLSRKRVCPPPRTKEWGAHRLRLKGGGSPNYNDWGKSLAHCLYSVVRTNGYSWIDVGVKIVKNWLQKRLHLLLIKGIKGKSLNARKKKSPLKSSSVVILGWQRVTPSE